jgi:hypothetical protein
MSLLSRFLLWDLIVPHVVIYSMCVCKSIFYPAFNTPLGNILSHVFPCFDFVAYDNFKLVGAENVYRETEELCSPGKLQLCRLQTWLYSDTNNTLHVFVSAKYLSCMQKCPAQNLNVRFKGPFSYYYPVWVYVPPKNISLFLSKSKINFLTLGVVTNCNLLQWLQWIIWILHCNGLICLVHCNPVVV